MQMLATLAADPLAQLVDTAYVGHLGAVQLAGQQQQQRQPLLPCIYVVHLPCIGHLLTCNDCSCLHIACWDAEGFTSLSVVMLCCQVMLCGC